MSKPPFNALIVKQVSSQIFVQVGCRRTVKLATSLSAKWCSIPCPGRMYLLRSPGVQTCTHRSTEQYATGPCAPLSLWLDKKLHASAVFNTLLERIVLCSSCTASHCVLFCWLHRKSHCVVDVKKVLPFMEDHIFYIQMSIKVKQLIPVAARSKAWFCGRWLAGVAGSNSAGGIF